MQQLMDFECIMSDLDTGETSVVIIRSESLDQALWTADTLTQPGQLWSGFSAFVPFHAA